MRLPSRPKFLAAALSLIGLGALMMRRRDDDASTGDVEACRAAVPIDPGLKSTSAMLGGHFYMGSDPAHIAYLKTRLQSLADAASGEDRRRILAFSALQGREGSTAAINSYDNQIVTWGTGWGGLGGLPAVMDRLVAASPAFVERLKACGVEYLGNGQWRVVDGGEVVTGKKEGLQAIRRQPVLLHLLIHLAKDPATRDAVTDAQLATFKAQAGSIPGSETIATQALFNFAAHLKHWAPAYMAGVVESAASAVAGAPTEARDRELAPEIVRGFYAKAKGYAWRPDWKQLQGYVRDMKNDGLDVTSDSVLAASVPPTGNA